MKRERGDLSALERLRLKGDDAFVCVRREMRVFGIDKRSLRSSRASAGVAQWVKLAYLLVKK